MRLSSNCTRGIILTNLRCDYEYIYCVYSIRQAMRRALRARFEQHQAQMRVLLDTGDSLLVYCARPSGYHMHEWCVHWR